MIVPRSLRRNPGTPLGREDMSDYTHETVSTKEVGAMIEEAASHLQ